MHPKRSLGQNFLTAPMVAHTMVKAGEVTKADTVIEIGPGKGALTRVLLESAGKVIAIEKDDALFEELQHTFAAQLAAGKLQLLHADALEVDISTPAEGEPYKILANIPYNITGVLLKKMLTASVQPSAVVLLVQKEVAQRIVAKEGKESILSMSVKVFGEPHYIQTVKAGSFFPKPNVDSAVLLITSISRANFASAAKEDVFFSLIKTGFAQKRKTLANNLKVLLPDIDRRFKTCSVTPSARAEELTLEQWFCILELE